MKKTFSSTILIVPGLRDHVANHWQTLLADCLENVRTVPPLETDKLNRDARVHALQKAIDEISGDIILVAHSAGAMIVAHWAKTASRPIKGALLATPADMERPFPAGYPDRDALDDAGWLPIPRSPLPFPTIVAASSNDPLGENTRITGLGKDWGAEVVNLGEVGHLNPASGFGEWPKALELITLLDQ